eukprot:s483_g2.t1
MPCAPLNCRNLRQCSVLGEPEQAMKHYCTKRSAQLGPGLLRSPWHLKTGLSPWLSTDFVSRTLCALETGGNIVAPMTFELQHLDILRVFVPPFTPSVHARGFLLRSWPHLNSRWYERKRGPNYIGYEGLDP